MNKHPVPPFVSLSRSQAKVFEQLSDEEFWLYVTEAAHLSPSSPSQADEYLVCRLGIRHCMFPLALLGEVVPPPHQRTVLPDVPPWMPGLATWRNEIIAEIDLEAYLWNGVEQGDKTADTRYPQRPPDLLLVVQAQGVTLGLLVTAVNTVAHFDTKHIVPLELAPDWCSVLSPKAVRGILDDVLVLNISAIFDDIVRNIKEQSLP
ncbi:MAG: chemotaxis protein CheW [Ktedonobacteraceae bacterium]|nr:chemotaxis protein CheW [Ktedonobacteraceae bacterium]